MAKLKVAIVGLGGVGGIHLEAYRTSDAVEVVAAAEIDPKKLGAAQARHGFKAFADYREMLTGATIDLVVVATPVSTHEEVVIAAAKAGHHVLCEKPLAVEVAAAKRMIQACKAAGVTLFYGATYRQLPALRAARDLVIRGEIGEVRLMREQEVGGTGPDGRQIMGFAHYPQGGPGGSGFGLVDHGIHLIDAFAWLTGSRVETVFGRGNISGADAAPEYLLMNFRSGALGHLLYEDSTFPTSLPGEGMFSWGAGWDINGYVPPGLWQNAPGCIHVHGSKGALRIFHYAQALFLTDKDGMRQIELKGRAAPGHFAAQVESCARSILDGAPVEVPGEVGLAALEVLEAAYRSFEEKQMVAVERS